MVRAPDRASRVVRRIYIIGVVFYLLLGVILAVPAYATENSLNPIAPVPGSSFNVPTGSDDASVLAYYDYLNLQHSNSLKETYLYDWQDFLVTYALIAAALIALYFFAFAWYARRSSGDLYPVEVFNGFITERGGPVDPFNWAAWSILGIYMVYYTVIQVIYGQLY
ncbi:MAG TPA: hypothetical protein VIL51_00015 [Thermoleophilia bacterium]|jgi:hypothetical protein